MLFPRGDEPELAWENGVLVFTGTAVCDLETAVEAQRRCQYRHVAEPTCAPWIDRLPPGSNRSETMLEYKGYKGHVELDRRRGSSMVKSWIRGTSSRSRGGVSRSSSRPFGDSVDDYFAFCAERGERPDKPFSGRLMVRLPSELHRTLYVEAKEAGKSLNQLINERLARAV